MKAAHKAAYEAQRTKAKSKPRASKRGICRAHRVTGKRLVIDGRQFDKKEQKLFALFNLTEYR